MISSLDSIEISIDGTIVDAFRIMAKQKILHEGWKGRNIKVKTENFVMCWLSEYGFKEVLGEHEIKYCYFGNYVGIVEKSPKEDFIIWIDGTETSIGIRSRKYEDLNRYREITYPDDRLREEKDIISDFIVICSVRFVDSKAVLNYWGAVSKKDFLDAYQDARTKFSPRNQERFRLVALSKFPYDVLKKILYAADSVRNKE